MTHLDIFGSDESSRKLLKNFTVGEFACNDGAKHILIDPLLVWILQNVRDHYNRPVIITSGYRTETYNKSIGGAQNSCHVYGMAADFYVEGVNPEDVQNYLEEILPHTGGIGKAKTYTHVDTRMEKARWTY